MKEPGALITTTVRDYDLGETSKLVRFLFEFIVVQADQSVNSLYLLVDSGCVYGNRDDVLLTPIHGVHTAAIHPSADGAQGPLRRKARRNLSVRKARRR